MRTLVTLASPATDCLGVATTTAPDFHDREDCTTAGSSKSLRDNRNPVLKNCICHDRERYLVCPDQESFAIMGAGPRLRSLLARRDRAGRPRSPRWRRA